MRIDAETLVYLSGALEKPIRYFFPDRLIPYSADDLTNLEFEFLAHLRNLRPNQRQRVAEYAKLLAELTTFEETQITQAIAEQAREFGLFDNDSEPSPQE